MMRNSHRGFTLLEILIALFVFTILSMMMMSALHNVIGIQSRTENKAEYVRMLQMAFLRLSHDIEQAVDRPVLNAQGKEESAFVGSAQGFVFTHAGFANPMNVIGMSNLQRTYYQFREHALIRQSWAALDAAQATPIQRKILIKDVQKVLFQYLGGNGRYYSAWPVSGEGGQPLPFAIKMTFTFSGLGSISQIYVISSRASKTAKMQPKS